MLVSKYLPTTQKSLFHKDIVNHIRKWIQQVETLANGGKPVKHLLLVYGPVGCAKTVTIEILFKSFNINRIDPTEIRSVDKINELVAGIPGYHDLTLSNIEKWNHKNKQEKSNLVMVDNVELCEKNIAIFVDTIHKKRNINVPIILICNNPKLKDMFSVYTQFSLIEFTKPSLLELSKLVTHINQQENLKLNKDQIKLIIQTSHHDVRQLFFIMDQWKHSILPFPQFIENVEQKHVDIDLINKLIYLFDGQKPFDMSYATTISSSEPMVINTGIYQNYLNIISYMGGDTNNTTVSTTSQCVVAADIMEHISRSNMLHHSIFNDQAWDLFEHYIMEGCIFPSYRIKQFSQTNTDNQSKNMEIDLFNTIVPFRDISYNFINSFEEVRRVCINNYFDPRLNPNIDGRTVFFNLDASTAFEIARILLVNIKKVSDYFDTNKKGKNTSKQEKIYLCQNITDPVIQQSFEHLVNQVFHYKMFEVELDEIIINFKQYTEEHIQKNLTRVNLRMLKRFLNIFTFDDSNKTFKSHIEAAVKYKILSLIIQQVQTRNEELKLQNQTRSIDSLTEDLTAIWKF
jgi:hypothetical protein